MKFFFFFFFFLAIVSLFASRHCLLSLSFFPQLFKNFTNFRCLFEMNEIFYVALDDRANKTTTTFVRLTRVYCAATVSGNHSSIIFRIFFLREFHILRNHSNHCFHSTAFIYSLIMLTWFFLVYCSPQLVLAFTFRRLIFFFLSSLFSVRNRSRRIEV